MSLAADYKATLALPATSFAMRANLAEREPQCLAQWQELGLFARMQRERKGAPRFVLHDGPPYANGACHHGHLLNKVLKDIIVRDRALSGYAVDYVPGWDCHGLPIESQVDRELGHKKHDMDVHAFHAACRDYANKQIAGQMAQFVRLGVMGSWDAPYKTLDFAYEADIVRQLAALIDTGLVYRGLKPVHWCVQHQTALAEAEVEYEDKRSSSAYVALALQGSTPAELEGAELVIWTTTPWSLPGNVGVMVHPELDYVVVPHEGRKLIVAAARVAHVWQEALGISTPPPAPLSTCKGAALAELSYQHPFLPRIGRVVPTETVEVDTGTGLVHTAPAHGIDDFAVAQLHQLPIISPVDAAGVLNEEAGPFAGQHIAQANDEILAHLAAHKRLLSNAALTLTHRYAHCWRCHKPVITRATEQWFLALDEPQRDATLRTHALKAVSEVTWIPSWGAERIGNMLRARPDWCLSRQRLWGVPLPILYCTACNEPHVSSATMRKVAEQIETHGAACWWSMDTAQLMAAVRCEKCGKSSWHKERDILDVWFDSGVSWAAVLARRGIGHPGADGPLSDLYLEGSDQHRGWFHSSLLTSVATTSRAPYRQVLTHGFVLDGKGRKVSKSRGNFVDPFAQIAKEGAEVWRLWAASEDFQQDVRISPEIMRRLTDSYRRVRNTLRFLLGNLNEFDFAKDAVAYAELEELDRWAIAQSTLLCARMRQSYASYSFHAATQTLSELCGQELSALYFDILKDRLYAAPKSGSLRRSAQTALYLIAHELTRTVAPILAFTSEEAWQALPAYADKPDSVHLTDYLEVSDAQRHRKGACERHDAQLLALARAAKEEHAQLDERMRIVKDVRRRANIALEEARRDKTVGSSTEAQLTLSGSPAALGPLGLYTQEQWADLLIVAAVGIESSDEGELAVRVARALGAKCARCWLVREEVDASAHRPICARCSAALEA